MNKEQVDYKEKYEEALERARNIRFGNPQSNTANVVCEEIFPELKESEDERIRKGLLYHFTTRIPLAKIWHDLKTSDIIAWLKKQGKQNTSDTDWMDLSEKDKERINRICEFIWKNRKGDTDEIYQQECDAEWLKSLKRGMKPTPEDFKMRQNIKLAI